MTTIGRFSGARSLPPFAALRRAADRVPEPARLPLMVGLLCEAVLLAWWLAFYPGLMSFDSITYVWQVTTGHWRSDHAVVYDVLVWLSLQITGGLAALTFLQTVALAASLGYVCHGLRTLGVRGRWAAAAPLAVVLVPSTGTFGVFVWKDSAYAIAAVLAFGACAHLAARQRPVLHWWLLAAGMLGLSVFRNNSYPALVTAGVVLLVAMPRQWRRIAAATLTPAVLALALNFGAYPAIGIQQPGTSSYYAFNYADIAVAYHRAPHSFRGSDLAVMRQVAPLTHWSSGGSNCAWVDPLMAAPFNRPAAERLNGKLLGVWGHVLSSRPDLMLSAHLCRGRIAWALPHTTTDIFVQPPVIPADRFGYSRPGGPMEHSRFLPALRADPPSASLHHAGVWAYTVARAPELTWLLWTGSLWCWATYLIVVRLVRRRPLRAALALAATTAGLQVAVLIATPAGLFRYIAAPVLLGFLAVPLLTAAHPADRPPGSEPSRRPARRTARSAPPRSGAAA
ncbi:hypothetical protein [Actinacidiphila paucisporea]|uniref:Glycosyltransferase RgtA/B/C/D-like domain-containing protein n=1 Tax=Actinacidiphila paucisporea TaxID=310782 RepID=A0A1M6W7M3_9ACTN|nr:hypothetical protein [Actinacidiphila paucisporea]SHK89774.1 hypothetical protein SAMN05216499_10220 [Actinacidiphila paucisporea]